MNFISSKAIDTLYELMPYVVQTAVALTSSRSVFEVSLLRGKLDANNIRLPRDVAVTELDAYPGFTRREDSWVPRKVSFALLRPTLTMTIEKMIPTSGEA